MIKYSSQRRSKVNFTLFNWPLKTLTSILLPKSPIPTKNYFSKSSLFSNFSSILHFWPIFDMWLCQGASVLSLQGHRYNLVISWSVWPLHIENLSLTLGHSFTLNKWYHLELFSFGQYINHYLILSTISI